MVGSIIRIRDHSYGAGIFSDHTGESGEVCVGRIKKWSIVPDQIRHLIVKEKPFVVCCAEEIVPRVCDDEFVIID